MKYCGTSKEQRIEMALLILKKPSLDFSFISFYFGSSITSALLFSWLEVNGLAEKESKNSNWTFYVYKIRQYVQQEASEEELKLFQEKINKAWQERHLEDYFNRQPISTQKDIEMHLHLLAFFTTLGISLYFWFLGMMLIWYRQGVSLVLLAGVATLLVMMVLVCTKYGGSNLFLYIALCIFWGFIVFPVISLICFVILSKMQLMP